MQSGRPRSSSTTDAPTSSAMMEIACAAAAAACLPGDEATAEHVSLLDFLFLLTYYSLTRSLQTFFGNQKEVSQQVPQSCGKR